MKEAKEAGSIIIIEDCDQLNRGSGAVFEELGGTNRGSGSRTGRGIE